MLVTAWLVPCRSHPVPTRPGAVQPCAHWLLLTRVFAEIRPSQHASVGMLPSHSAYTLACRTSDQKLVADVLTPGSTSRSTLPVLRGRPRSLCAGPKAAAVARGKGEGRNVPGVRGPWCCFFYPIGAHIIHLPGADRLSTSSLHVLTVYFFAMS